MIDYLMDCSRRYTELAGSFIFNFDCPIIVMECFTETQQLNISQMLSNNVDKLNCWCYSPQYYQKLQSAIERRVYVLKMPFNCTEIVVYSWISFIVIFIRE